jgi:flagellar biosynthesis protein FlhG
MSAAEEIVLYNQTEKAQFVTVSGGKGGIGKTFFSVNLAVELKNRGYKVLLFDADINLANVNILLHIDENNRFQDFIDGNIALPALIQKGVGGVDAIYVGDDLDQILEVDERQYSTLLEGLTQIENKYDFIIIDTGAGLNALNMKLMILADRNILLANPEATALVDLYRVIKIMAKKLPEIRYEVVVNKTASADSAARIYSNISETVTRFRLNASLSFLGYILEDGKRVFESIQKRIPLLILHDTGKIQECFRLVTDAFLKGEKLRRRFYFFYNLLRRK